MHATEWAARISHTAPRACGPRQVHYLEGKPKGDSSGVALRLQPGPTPLSAGLLSYASFFSIPPGRKRHPIMNTCCYRGFQPLDAFAVRVHTHAMGRAVIMTRPDRKGNGE